MNDMELCEKIKSGKIFLILGQEYYGNKNPLLESIKSEYNLENTQISYDIFLKLEDKTKLQWIKGKSNTIITPDSLDIISKLPWNTVITSAVDNIVSREFRNNWRNIYEISNADNKVVNSITNRNKLCFNYLFGNISNDLDGSRPPVNSMEYLKSKTNAVRLLARYSPEVITPLGTVMIDGYNIENDWLKTEDIIPILSCLGKGQVHFFGGHPSESNNFWKSILDSNILVEHDESLLQFLIDGEINDLINFEELLVDYENSKRVFINNQSKSIPKDVFNSIINDAIILDDSILISSEMNDDDKYDKFRYFLYESGSKPVWEGYQLGFNFKRKCEAELIDKIDAALKESFDVKPIILHGQSGAGKSVVLGNAAYKLKNRKKYPILFIPSYVGGINYANIKDVCKWLEDNRAQRTIIIWDASVFNDEISQYIELNRYLVSSGRKVLIIGSSLKLSDKFIQKYEYEPVEITSYLDKDEKIDLIEVFNKFSGLTISEEQMSKFEMDNVVVSLYRLLPASRHSLRRGIVNEAQKNQVRLKDAFKIEKSNFGNNLLMEAFLKAGIYLPQSIEEDEVYKNLESLLKVICVPAQFGLKIPFSILLRYYGYENTVQMVDIIEDLDFFRLYEKSDGEYIVTVRNSLEAEIVVNEKLSDIRKQIDVVMMYLENITIKDEFMGDTSEINFAIDLLKAIGPNGRQDDKFIGYYRMIAEKLEDIRLNGIWNTRTILQEATYIREYAKSVQLDSKVILKLFKKSQKLLEDEINRIKSESEDTTQLVGFMLSELASNKGAQLVFMLGNSENNIRNIVKLYAELNDILKQARCTLPDSFYALDVCAWSSLIILNYRDISDEKKEEVYANALALYEQAEIDTPMLASLEQFNKRLLELSDNRKKHDISEIVFKKLLEIDSGAGIYLRAKDKLSGIDLNTEMTKESLQICRNALNYLEEYKKIVYNDERCLYLLFRIKWLINAKKPLLYLEKTKLNFKRDTWEDFNTIIDKLFELMPESRNALLWYIKAIALFHLNLKDQYVDCFKKVSHLYYPFNKRIIINYIATNDDGTSRKYTGSLQMPLSDNKAKIYINEIGLTVPYFNPNFVRRSHTKEEYYDHIELGFNFLGIQVTNVSDPGGVN